MEQIHYLDKYSEIQAIWDTKEQTIDKENEEMAGFLYTDLHEIVVADDHKKLPLGF